MSCPKELDQSSKGFSLSEAIVAMAVLLIGVLAVLQLFPAGVKLGAGSRYKTIATNLAQAKMEEIYSKPYVDVAGEAKDYITTDQNDPNHIYQREVVVTTVNGTLTPGPENDLKQIIVRVFWNENQQEQKVELASLISKP